MQQKAPTLWVELSPIRLPRSISVDVNTLCSAVVVTGSPSSATCSTSTRSIVSLVLRICTQEDILCVKDPPRVSSACPCTHSATAAVKQQQFGQESEAKQCTFHACPHDLTFHDLVSSFRYIRKGTFAVRDRLNFASSDVSCWFDVLLLADRVSDILLAVTVRLPGPASTSLDDRRTTIPGPHGAPSFQKKRSHYVDK